MMEDNVQQCSFWKDKAECFGNDLSSTDKCKTIQRSISKYENRSNRFVMEQNKRDFKRQYAHIYASRLMTTRDSVEKAAHTKWGFDVPIKRLFELKVDEKCVVIGTLYKHMSLKPNILHELSEDHSLAIPPTPREKFTGPEDELILEDELQRITLIGNIETADMVTGIVLAIYGQEPSDQRGKLHVDDYCCKEFASQVERPLLPEDRYVLLVSGLQLHSLTEDSLATQLLTELITGQCGASELQKQMAKITRVIIAGNSLCADSQDKDAITKAKYLTKKTTAGTVEAVKALDDVLVQLAASMHVDLMPGDYDPTNHMLPQQPLHQCMFPQASRYPTLHCTTNPYQGDIDGVQFIGHSGQPVNDIYSFSDMNDRLTILSNTLSWGHIAPTAPDTLHCYPYYDSDPFVLETCPHVYFCGNQPKFQSKFLDVNHKSVRVICVPSFATSKTAVMVNLRDLSCCPITVGATVQNNQSTASSPEVDK